MQFLYIASLSTIVLSGQISPIAIAALLLVGGLIIYTLVKRYVRVPENQVMVKYGMVSSDADGGRSAKILRKGSTFVWPIIQAYDFLDLRNIEINYAQNVSDWIKAEGAVDCTASMRISEEDDTLVNAAEGLLGSDRSEIRNLAADLIAKELMHLVAKENEKDREIDRSKFQLYAEAALSTELNKIGIELIEVNLTDNSIFK